MPTLKHPTIPGVTRDVHADAVDKWKAAGWLDPRAKGPEPDDKTPRSATTARRTNPEKETS